MRRQITAVVQTSAEPVSLLETINLNKKESVLAAESVVKLALKIVAVAQNIIVEKLHVWIYAGFSTWIF